MAGAPSSNIEKWEDFVGGEAHLESRIKDSKDIVSYVILQTMRSHYDIKKDRAMMRCVFQKEKNDRNVYNGMKSFKTMKAE